MYKERQVNIDILGVDATVTLWEGIVTDDDKKGMYVWGVILERDVDLPISYDDLIGNEIITSIGTLSYSGDGVKGHNFLGLGSQPNL